MVNTKRLHQLALSLCLFLSTQRLPICSTFQIVGSRYLHLEIRKSYEENPYAYTYAETLLFLDNGSRKEVRSMGRSTDNELSLSQMEEDVIASANEKLDIKRVKNVLFPDNISSEDSYIRSREEMVKIKQPSQLSIAFASGSVTAIASFVIFHVPILSALVFFVITYIASRDPTVESDGLVEGDEISGPIARIVGRATIKSIEQSKPKVKAVARAVISGDEELNMLRKRIIELEVENKEMDIWIQRRRAVDEKSKLYSMDALKDMARMDGLPVGGTKAQLMMRLLEAGSLKL